MKRLLLESIKAIPYAIGQAVERLGTMSAVLGINVTAADAGAVAKVTITHCDTSDGTYEAVPDERVFLNDTIVERDASRRFTQCSVSAPVVAGQLLNVDIDLLGCKRFIKVGVDYGAAAVTATYVLTLGDYSETPPNME